MLLGLWARYTRATLLIYQVYNQIYCNAAGQHGRRPDRDRCPAIDTIPAMDELQGLSVEKVKFNSSWLIPDIKFVCNGTIRRVRVAGIMDYGMNLAVSAPSRPPRDNPSMKLQIWRENVTERGMYHKVNEIALPSMCKRNMLEEDKMFQARDNIDMTLYNCSLQHNTGTSITVKSGDVLGIELPPEHNTRFKIYSSTECRLTNFIIEHNSSSTVDLHSGIDNETTTQPLMEVEVDSGM